MRRILNFNDICPVYCEIKDLVSKSRCRWNSRKNRGIMQIILHQWLFCEQKWRDKCLKWCFYHCWKWKITYRILKIDIHSATDIFWKPPSAVFSLAVSKLKAPVSKLKAPKCRIHKNVSSRRDINFHEPKCYFSCSVMI